MNFPKLVMKSNRGFVIFISVIISSFTIRCVLGEYELIYYFLTSTNHHIPFQEVKYDAIDKHYVVKTANKEKVIYTACPRRGEYNPSTLEIRNMVAGKVAITRECEILPIPTIYLSKNSEVYSVFGFLVHTPYLEQEHYHFYNIPKYHMVIGLIYLKFDEIFKRVVLVRYSIFGGKFLKVEPSRYVAEFTKNENIYGYDIDALYSEPSCPFVKVPLAAEEDFLFDSWKLASQQNVLTAPMLRDLLSQWQALEIFVRRISQVIDSIAVTTGVFGHLLDSPSESTTSTAALEYVHLENGKLRPPQYFWKAVSLQFSHDDQQYSYGILFVMHNVLFPDPNARSGIRKVCSAYDFDSLGWTFLESSKFKGPMYGCPFDRDIMKFLGEEIEGEFEEFDLNLVSTLKLDEESNPTVVNVNVVEEIKRLTGSEEDDIVYNIEK